MMPYNVGALADYFDFCLLLGSLVSNFNPWAAVLANRDMNRGRKDCMALQ